MNSQKTTIYYDGLCLACSTEINHYRKQVGAETMNFVDIMAQGFSADAHGIDPQRVHKYMHVKDRHGRLHEGVDAFKVIWSNLPRYHFLDRLSDQFALRALMNLGYSIFVKVRPYLPRRKAGCEDSPYCETYILS